MLPLRWHPIQNWPEKQKRRDCFPRLAPAKTNSLTSEHGVLLHWICLPACLCQSPTETEREREKEREKYGRGAQESFCSARCSTCHREETKGRARGFRAARSSLLSLRLVFLHCPVHLRGSYIVTSFKAEREWTYCVFQILGLPGDQLNEQKSLKILFSEEKHDQENTQATSLPLKGGVTLCGRWFYFVIKPWLPSF